MTVIDSDSNLLVSFVCYCSLLDCADLFARNVNAIHFNISRHQILPYLDIYFRYIYIYIYLYIYTYIYYFKLVFFNDKF